VLSQFLSGFFPPVKKKITPEGKNNLDTSGKIDKKGILYSNDTNQ
jgi:hypothetical protein